MPDISLQFNKHFISTGDMSGNLDSGIIDLSNVVGYCVDALWSGTPVGNIIVEGSNNGVVFKPLVTQATGGTSGQLLDNVDGVHYNYLKVIYIPASGSGTLDVYISGKKYV